jgi:hypothetical protein
MLKPERVGWNRPFVANDERTLPPPGTDEREYDIAVLVCQGIGRATGSKLP